MNFKKILCACLAATLAVGVSPAVFASETEAAADAVIEEAVLTEDGDASLMATSGNYTYEIIDGEATITGIDMSTSSATKLKLPSTLGGKSVTAIANGAGVGLEKITEIDMTNLSKLKTIGDNCFSYCPKLTTIKLSYASITSIGNNAFYYCPNLTTISGENYLSSLKKVGSSAFGMTPYMEAKTDEFVKLGNVLVKYNGTDTEVEIPSAIVAIADAFFGKDITSVTFKGTKVAYIGNNAFYGCRSLTEIDIPDSCTEIGDMAFSGCSSLTTVTYGDKLKTVGFCSFANCPELKTFTYRNSATKTSPLVSIGECAFWNDIKLFYLDTGIIENVNVGSFWNCFGETPDEVGGIYYYKIPETVKTIAEGGYGNLWFSYVAIPQQELDGIASTAFGSTSGASYIIHKDSAVEQYFKNSKYYWYNYGDLNISGEINSIDIKKIAEYIAKNIAKLCAEKETQAEKDVLNYDSGKGVIADINGDGAITTRDLYEVFRSIKADYEAEKAAEAETAAE